MNPFGSGYGCQGGGQGQHEVPFWSEEKMEAEDADEEPKRCPMFCCCSQVLQEVQMNFCSKVEKMEDGDGEDDQHRLPVAEGHHQRNPFKLEPRCMPLRLRHFAHKWRGQRPYDRHPPKRDENTPRWT